MTNTTLLPCPFCGEEAETHETTDGWIVACSSDQNVLDGFTHRAHGYGSTEAEAIAEWNKRVERTCRMEYNEDWSGDELYPTVAYQCSVCGRITQEGLPDYCPHCGAKVVGSDEAKEV